MQARLLAFKTRSVSRGRSFSTFVQFSTPPAPVILGLNFPRDCNYPGEVSHGAELEIEKKFPYTQETFEICRRLAKKHKENSMVDIYYDNKDCTFTKNDFWLRNRNREFELKQPKVSLCDQLKALHSNGHCSGIDQYFEITDVQSIMDAMNPLLSSRNTLNHSSYDYSLEKFLSENEIRPFGIIMSHRNRFEITLPLFAQFPRRHSLQRQRAAAAGDWQISMFVDFDEIQYVNPLSNCEKVSNRYQIAEIELKSSSSSQDIPLSLETIFQQISAQLKIPLSSSSSPPRGKVLEYLSRFHPDHYQELKNCGQLASKGINY